MLSSIEMRQDQINQLYEKIFPDEMSQSREPQGGKKANHGSSNLSDKALILKAKMAKNGEEFKALWDGSTLGYNGDDSAADMALMNMLAFWTGGNAVQMERLFSASARGKRSKWLDRADYRKRTVEKAISGARKFYEHPKVGSQKADANRAEEQEAANPTKLREIIVTNRHMHDITAESMPELVAYNFPPKIFVKSGCLVQIVEDERGITRIETLSESALRSSLSRCARYMAIYSKKTVACDPPMVVVKDILAVPNWPGILPITGLITSPVVRPDGTIISKLGYDAATGLYYAGNAEMALQVPEKPTKDDAVKAAAYIMAEVFGDFPFKDDASRANTMAALLTTITKPLINGNVPLGLFDKPQAGTGASLLTEIIAEIATGEKAKMQTAPGTEEEWRKAITSVLIQGPQIEIIDNVTKTLRSSKLSQMLTARTWSDRMLGQNKMLDLPQTAAWFATGNNLQLGGDIARRAYWVRLDAARSRPWLRDGFKHPEIVEWVKEHRGELLSMLLVMVRAWVVAGQPKGSSPRIGSFERWSRVIGGILTFSGVDGFLGNAAELYDSADQENAQWDMFLEQWQLLHRDDKITAAQLKTELTDFQYIYKPFQNEMPEEVIKATDKGSRGASVLGQVLHRHADQIFPSGRKLTFSQDSHTKAMKWRVITSRQTAEDAKSSKSTASSRFAEDAEDRSISNVNLKMDDKISKNRMRSSPASSANVADDSENGILASSANEANGLEVDLLRANSERTAKEVHFRGVAEKHMRKPSPTDYTFVRFLKEYRTRIPRPGEPNTFDDKLYLIGETVELQQREAEDLLKRCIVELAV